MIKMKTTVRYPPRAGGRPNLRQTDSGPFKQDKYAFNVNIQHLLHGLERPECQEWIKKCQGKLQEYRNKIGGGGSSSISGNKPSPTKAFAQSCQLQAISRRMEENSHVPGRAQTPMPPPSSPPPLRAELLAALAASAYVAGGVAAAAAAGGDDPGPPKKMLKVEEAEDDDDDDDDKENYPPSDYDEEEERARDFETQEMHYN